MKQDLTDALLYELVYQIRCTYISDLYLVKKDRALLLMERNKKRYLEQYGDGAVQKVLEYLTKDNTAYTNKQGQIR